MLIVRVSEAARVIVDPKASVPIRLSVVESYTRESDAENPAPEAVQVGSAASATVVLPVELYVSVGDSSV